jgi:hypothetical protein
MKSFKYYQIVLFILILLKISNCADEYKNKGEDGKNLVREQKAIHGAIFVANTKQAYAYYKELKELFKDARNAYKCYQQGTKDCFNKIHDSFTKNDNYEVLKSFDKVFDKLDKISNELSTEFNCEFLEQEYNNIWQLIIRILRQIKPFINDRNNKNLKKNLQGLCRDYSEGIDKIHSLIENYLDDKKLIKIAFNCYKYNFNELEDFHYKTLTMILQFMIISSNCEQLFNYNEFDYNKFWHEIENHLTYYKDYIFPLQFSQDSGYNGLNQSVTRILKENKNAKKAVEQLNKAYGYFDWSVIIFDKKFESYGFISYIQISNNSLCGSIIYDDLKLFGIDRDAKALVSYCYTKDLENENIKIELYENNPKMSTIETAKINNNLNYVLTVIIPICNYNYYIGDFINLEKNRNTFPFGSVESVNCEKDKIRFFDFFGTYKSESIRLKLKTPDIIFNYKANINYKVGMKIFVANIPTKLLMSKPKLTSQSFSLPENEFEAKSNVKIKKGNI